MDEEYSNDAFMPPDRGSMAGAAVHPSMLKACDFCGALNLEMNRECFICGWHGHFDRDARRISVELQVVAIRNGVVTPRLFTDAHTFRLINTAIPWWKRALFRMAALFGK